MAGHGRFASSLKFTAEDAEIYTTTVTKNKKAYINLLENPDKYGKDFWDVIIITAIDETQKRFYEIQLTDKLLRRELPLCAKYHVISDPPGKSRIGCGGSTLVCLQFLEETYGSKLDEYRVLLIHAGGFSKRLPNHSVSGKIFCPIPLSLGEGYAPCISMLELRLILFMDFPRKMPGGVYIACADDIQMFESQIRDFSSPGFTALAHPAITSVGLTHGVFVLDTASQFDRAGTRSCKRFLHKPTLELMKQTGAVDADGMVLVDSNFFFDRDVSKRLVKFYNSITLDCEVDAYGDFLQPLGSAATPEYFTSTRTTGSSVPAALVEKRKGLYEMLAHTPITVLPMKPSLFIHVGTCPEYTEHLCINLPQFSFKRFVYSQVVFTGVRPAQWNDPASRFRPISGDLVANRNIGSECCVMWSVLSDNVTLGDNTVIEFCRLVNRDSSKRVKIGRGSILSQIVLPPTVTRVLDYLFLHTFVLPPVSTDGGASPVAASGPTTPRGGVPPNLRSTQINVTYATVLYGIEDDFKASSSADDFNLTLNGVALAKLLPHLGLTLADVWGPDVQNYGLWQARLFPVCESAEKSVETTAILMDIMEAINHNSTFVPQADWSKLPRMSMAQATASKNLAGHVQNRDKHEQLITFLKIQNLFKKQVDVEEWLPKLPLVSAWIKSLTHRLPPSVGLSHIGSYEKFQFKLDDLIQECADHLEENDALEKSRAQFSLAALLQNIAKRLDESNPLYAHYMKWSARLSHAGHAYLRDSIVEPFVEPVSSDFHLPFLRTSAGNPKLPLSVGTKVVHKRPARIILAGGWSDTPPFALEWGGDIVNMAVEIDGKLPIVVTATVIDEPVLRLVSKDDRNCEISYKLNELSRIFGYDVPEEMLALHKACVAFCLFPNFTLERNVDNRKEADLYNIFRSLFGTHGLEVHTDVDIPKGSGLGTSSILILAVVRTIRQLFGAGIGGSQDVERRAEFNAVLAIEQLLTTGGGWQDQVGGGIDGLKFIKTAPGPNPEYSITQVVLDEAHINYLNDRLLVVYTGKTRVAKTILANVVENYTTRKRGTEQKMFRIKDKAVEMYKCFQEFASNPIPSTAVDDAFDRLGVIFEGVKTSAIDLEETISNPYIDSLFDSISNFVTGSNIIGAGSGGFILGFLKPGVAKDDVREYLSPRHPNAQLTEMTLWVEKP